MTHPALIFYSCIFEESTPSHNILVAFVPDVHTHTHKSMVDIANLSHKLKLTYHVFFKNHFSITIQMLILLHDKNFMSNSLRILFLTGVNPTELCNQGLRKNIKNEKD